MPANIAERDDGTAMMFYAGEVPWHGLGVGVERAKTSKQAIKFAGLDWDVALGPSWGGPDIEHAKEQEGRRSIYRVTDGRVFGQVSPEYQLFQNMEAFEFLDSIVEDANMTYHAAGALQDGRRIWILAQLQADWSVGDDLHRQYMLLTTGHYTTPIVGFPTDVRVICANTLSASILQLRRDQGARALRFSIPHRHGMRSRLEDARELLRVSTAAQRRMQEFLEKQSKTMLSQRKVDLIVEDIFGEVTSDSSAVKRHDVDAFREIHAAEVKQSGKNAYAMVNAVTGFGDHAMRYHGEQERQAEARFASTLMDGRAADFKRKGIGALMAATA